MLNLDKLQARKAEIMNNLAQAVRENDETKMRTSMEDFQQFVSDQVMAEAQGIVEAADRTILNSRGVRQLTSKEKEYYNKLIANAKQQTGVITNIEEALPETVIDSTLEGIRTAHPLLNAVDMQNTGAAIKWTLNAKGEQRATWDVLNTAITAELTGKIDVINMELCKLTAFMYVTKDMLDLGPEWVDKYVREVLGEAVAVSSEVAIVDGDGVKCPIGMTRNFVGTFDQSTGYARKETIEVTQFDVMTYGRLLASMAVDRNGKSRAIAEVVLIVNPVDYFSKVMPATTFLTELGSYVTNVFPFPTRVIQSVGAPEGKAVIGIGSNYFFGIGTAKGGKLEYDDSYKYLEDLRTYVIRLYGNGRPVDINSFLLLDISNLAPLQGYASRSYNSETDTAYIASLTFGGLTLEPAFDKGITEYTATTDSASAVLVAIPKDGDSTVSVTAGGKTYANGSSISFANNAVTTVDVTVQNGSVSETYTIVVTRGTVSGDA